MVVYKTQFCLSFSCHQESNMFLPSGFFKSGWFWIFLYYIEITNIILILVNDIGKQKKMSPYGESFDHILINCRKLTDGS